MKFYFASCWISFKTVLINFFISRFQRWQETELIKSMKLQTQSFVMKSKIELESNQESKFNELSNLTDEDFNGADC